MNTLGNLLVGLGMLLYIGGSLVGIGTFGWGIIQLFNETDTGLKLIGLALVIGFGSNILGGVLTGAGAKLQDDTPMGGTPT